MFPFQKAQEEEGESETEDDCVKTGCQVENTFSSVLDFNGSD